MLEGTRRTKLLLMEITLHKSSDLVFKLSVDPTTINLGLSGWNWSLLTVSQSLRFFKSEFILLASTLILKLEVKVILDKVSKWTNEKRNYLLGSSKIVTRVVQYTQLESIRLWYLRFDKPEIDS